LDVPVLVLLERPTPLADVRNYDWLVRQRGWTLEEYQDWYVQTVSAAIFTS